MPKIDDQIDTVRSSRAGHTFHERWAARRALQLIFPKDGLFAIAVEGISSTETATPGDEAEDVADLVLYYGEGDSFASCDNLETIQFKYKVRDAPVTASYLRKTIEKFCDTLVGYEKDFPRAQIDAKLSFSFVTNAEFSSDLLEAIGALKSGLQLPVGPAADQVNYLTLRCKEHALNDPSRLFSKIEFRAAEKHIQGQSNLLRRTLTDWSAGADTSAKVRLFGLQELMTRKAGPGGQHNNLVKREDVLDALDCEPEDLFPADTRFIDVGAVVERADLNAVEDLVKSSALPIFIHADGGVGKTVFIQSLAARLSGEFEVVVFDCFGGGAYRSEDQARHLPKVGLVQIANELASRGLCDPLLPTDSDRIGLIRAARKRFTQAAQAVRDQSDKLGLLLILDAADNAQVEADHRNQDAFPQQLLASLDGESIHGVKLVLTARTHRMPNVVRRAKVEPVELGPFTDAEARLFLDSRRERLSAVEYATAMARSGGNARVLDYLVQTWDTNILKNAPPTLITVKEIIAQRCQKIFDDLRIAGWQDSEVREFFAALSLLPPPIPLDELANALGWSKSQVTTAASDLAPMLENLPLGAIFRDEPTETYVRETYSGETLAQQAIAERLLKAQGTSTYAAEALPHFLVVISDSDRAFELANSTQFPTSIQSDFGRRRLILARLYAAFRLAVSAGDLDRVLGLTMRLAQVASANVRGDQFIRRSPALATMLGDPDAYRRLFNDRTGWRGARSARLTIAHSFAGAMDEALIQRETTVRWINWNIEQIQDEDFHNRSGPEISDFAAVLFQSVLQGEHDIVDRNLVRWKPGFSRSASLELLSLLAQYDRHSGTTVLQDFVQFASGPDCRSVALKIVLLSRQTGLGKAQLKALASGATASQAAEDDEPGDEDFERPTERGASSEVVRAALTALVHCSRASSARILAGELPRRLSSYDFAERYGPSKAWSPVLHTCVSAWSSGARLSYYHLLPSEVKITRQAKSIADGRDLLGFLKKLEQPRVGTPGKREKHTAKRRFSDHECDDIRAGIDLILALVKPIEEAILAQKGVSATCVASFLSTWRRSMRTSIHRRAETPTDQLARTVGIGWARILLSHAQDVTIADAQDLVDLISIDRFTIGQKTDVLTLLAKRPSLHDVAGRFARHIAEHILKDEYIEQRGESYADLASALVPMSIAEAREYYRQGLAQLDQMGGDDYDQIYSLLHYAGVQAGGNVRPVLAQRLMNLCQTIAHNDSSKFGWTLFARAAAKSIGFPAGHKLLRWDDQDVADFSYGLPQLACFLAESGQLDPRRAAFLMQLCEDHGWHDWQVGDGVGQLLTVAAPGDRRAIVLAILGKLKAEHPFGAWPSLWESLLKLREKYPEALTEDDVVALQDLKREAQRKQDAHNSRNSSPGPSLNTPRSGPSEEEITAQIAALIKACDPTSAVTIDAALKKINDEKSLPFTARKRFLDGLRAECPYDKRLGFLFAICEASEFEFDRAVDLLEESIALWSESSTHIKASAAKLVERLFDLKGSELFYLQYLNIPRRIDQLAAFCGDAHFVMGQALKTIALEQLELDGDEWLQLATSLCKLATPSAGLEALETLLSGPSLRIADEIGEGPFHENFSIVGDQHEYLAGIVWQLLGDDDAYMRWTAARGISTLADLGLFEDILTLVEGYDRQQVPALISPDVQLSFQNSQQWLLIGLARAILHHGQKLGYLRPKLVALAQRSDVHAVNKVHIARCLENLRTEGDVDAELDALRSEIENPALGYVTKKDWPTPVKSTSGFNFDYEFDKTEVERLAQVFGRSKGETIDVIAAEIKKRWPLATGMDYFSGSDRYRRDSDDRYEFYREHVQKHALFAAATTLFATSPIVRHSYDAEDSSPWAEWLQRYDVTFDDGSWLADRKDSIPACAKESILGPRDGQQETLQDHSVMLAKLGFLNSAPGANVLIYGHWTTPDGVYVNIISALSDRKGAVGRCEAFARVDSHDLWLPQFWDGGEYEERYHQPNPFAPFIWAPDAYGTGIDEGDEIAAKGPAARPRLGLKLTKRLGIAAEPMSGNWHGKDGASAISSQVWGKWRPDPDQRRNHYHDDGEILWATPNWLDQTLSQLGKRLVYTVTLSKYRSSKSYDETTGAKAVFVGLRTADPDLRFWHAKKASKQNV